MKKNRVLGIFAVACFAVLSGLVVRVEAQKEKPLAPKAGQAAVPAPAVANSTTPQLTASDLEAYLDGMMPLQLARENIAGAVVAVVKDGKVLFMKGYGFSDVAKQTPVTADATLFRPGSISKLFTWTSVMQQVEQGKLDLDKDVNEYIDFKIPPAFGKPITLRNIMTHTAGFQETVKDLFVADAAHLTPVDDYLKNHIPARIFPPGVVPAYSNYATTLAGYIVQRVSGKPFAEYIQENIFAPLDMKHTTFVQPLPADLAPLMSSGYRKGTDKPQPFEFVEAFPAGSVSTTARDMCNFMIAHLQDGQFEGKQILKPETAKQMHSRIFGTDDRMPGMAHGFYEEIRNGHRIIAHGGDTQYFHSDLHLILDTNIGLFVSYNSAGKGEVSNREMLLHGFLDRYFPYTIPAGEKVGDPKADIAQIAGSYTTSRRSETTFVKLLSLGEAKVYANDDGTLSIDAIKAPAGVPVKFEEISPFLFREVHGQDKVAFKKDASGNWQFQLDWPIFIFQKVGLIQDKTFNLGLIIFGLGVIVLTLLLWPVSAVFRKHYDRPLTLDTAQRKSRFLAHMVCLLFAATLLGWVVALSKTDSLPALNGMGTWIIVAGILGLLSAVGALWMVVYALRSWQSPTLWKWAKLHNLLLALACVCVVWFAFFWNLMNFNTNF